jgi:hypothetical protein
MNWTARSYADDEALSLMPSGSGGCGPGRVRMPDQQILAASGECRDSKDAKRRWGGFAFRFGVRCLRAAGGLSQI